MVHLELQCMKKVVRKTQKIKVGPAHIGLEGWVESQEMLEVFAQGRCTLG